MGVSPVCQVNLVQPPHSINNLVTHRRRKIIIPELEELRIKSTVKLTKAVEDLKTIESILKGVKVHKEAELAFLYDDSFPVDQFWKDIIKNLNSQKVTSNARFRVHT